MWKHIGPILQDSDVRKVRFKHKWPFTIYRYIGIWTCKGSEFDVMVAAYLLDPTRTAYRLDDLVKNYLGQDMAVPMMISQRAPETPQKPIRLINPM